MRTRGLCGLIQGLKMEKTPEEMLEDDEITPEEEGFMIGE